MKRLTEQEMKDRTDRQMQSHLEANKVKDILGHEGYTFSMSLYGVIINYETTLPEYRRIEIFMKGSPHQEDVLYIKHFFNEFFPYTYYSIWAYDKDSKEILCIDSWN